MKCKNKTASYNDKTCPFDEMFGLKLLLLFLTIYFMLTKIYKKCTGSTLSRMSKKFCIPLFARLSAKMTVLMAFKNTKQKHKPFSFL